MNTVFTINGDDFSEKLKDFSISCKNCNSKNVTLDVESYSYPSASWFRVEIICNDCKHDEEIYSS
jgi:hypothetical protein